MSRFISCTVALLFCLANPANGAGAHTINFITAADSRGEIVVELQFPAPDLAKDRAGRISPRIEGLPGTMEAGLPSVPVKTLKIALPSGTTLGGVQLIEGEHSAISGEVTKASAMIPMSWLKNPPRLAPAAAPRYHGNFFPESRVQTSLQYLHGVPVAIVNVYPLRVARDGKTSDFLGSAVLRIGVRALSPAPAAHPLFAHQAREVEAFVDNPGAVSSYETRGRSAAAYDYLIVSTSDLIAYSGADGLKDFQSSLAARSLQSKVVDLATIDSQGSGRDLPEKIRNFIKTEYSASGIRYVLLAGVAKTGKDGFIPARPLWSKIKAYMNGQWSDVEENIPSDFYYAALDGSFNGNNNDKWGEPDDGDRGGDVDFVAEVTVGRAVLDSTDDLQNFVKKTSWAGKNTLSRQVFLLGEDLFPEMHLTGGTYMNQLMGDVTEHGFSTKGYPSGWQADKLYDSDHSWSGSEALSKINSGGFSMVNHLGHSNQYYNMKMSAYMGLPSFTNANPFFFYTQGCLAGRFIDGSFVDKMVKHTNAAFAAVGNSTYGLAPEDPTPTTTATPGASQMFHRQFIHALFNGTSAAGKAHQVSKEAFIGLKAAQEVRWVDWSATYFGDPSVPLNF